VGALPIDRSKKTRKLNSQFPFWFFITALLWETKIGFKSSFRKQQIFYDFILSNKVVSFIVYVYIMSIQQRKGSSKRDSMSQFLNRDDGLRQQQLRKGIQPKDHMKENMRELRQAQSEHRDRKEEESRPAKELYKLSQFRDVSSRLYETSERTRRKSLDNKEFLSKGVSDSRREQLAMESRIQRLELERQMEEAKHYSSAALPDTPRKDSVPKEVALLAPPSNIDFINRNKMKAITMATEDNRTSAQQQQQAKHEDYGRVPDYLEERKAQWAEQEAERRRRMPDPNCPPGMCLMPEAERRNTLDTLQSSKEEALQQLRRMPFVIETPSMRKKQEALEAKLREIDNAIGIFSKEKVYIAK
jgi:hypothetical protein